MLFNFIKKEKGWVKIFQLISNNNIIEVLNIATEKQVSETNALQEKKLSKIECVFNKSTHQLVTILLKEE